MTGTTHLAAASPDPGSWPLSAAATAVLRNPRTRPAAVLRLALRELVVRGVLEVGAVRSRRWSPDEVELRPGTRPPEALPAPLPGLAEALLPHVRPDGSDAAQAVQASLGRRADLPQRLRQDCREALSERGLLRSRRARLLGVVPHTRWEPTPSGAAWAQVADRLERETTAGVLPAAGLLLALDTEVARRRREVAVDAGEGWGPADGDLDALDRVLGDVGPALDGAADGGSGGDGGDGGGGD